MSRALLVLHNDAMRERAIDWIRRLPKETRVEFKSPRRSLPQNDLMWALLTDIAKQIQWFGEWRSPPDFKDIFTAGFRKCQVVPGIDHGTVVPLGMRTSEFSKEEMSAFIEYIYAEGSKMGVKFNDEAP